MRENVERVWFILPLSSSVFWLFAVNTQTCQHPLFFRDECWHHLGRATPNYSGVPVEANGRMFDLTYADDIKLLANDNMKRFKVCTRATNSIGQECLHQW